MKKRLLILMLSLIAVFPVLAGDVANYINLGFSTDNRYFMFAQYGIEEGTTYPYAELFIVDVYTNNYVPEGVKKFVRTKNVEPGDTGIGACFAVVAENLSLIKKYKIDYMFTGRILYLLVNGTEPKAEINFRDFVTGNTYTVKLYQNVFGDSASFYIELSIASKSGKQLKYTVGLPGLKRKGVVAYRIKQIIVSPDGRSLIVLMEKDVLNKDGIDIRYMIETVKLSL